VWNLKEKERKKEKGKMTYHCPMLGTMPILLSTGLNVNRAVQHCNISTSLFPSCFDHPFILKKWFFHFFSLMYAYYESLPALHTFAIPSNANTWRQS
jgi:hypothetical protein